jgi:MarR family transcriptional regulator, transcriptional regulator for hemolysin
MESLLNFGFLLKDVSRLYSRNFERHAARLELTLHQCRVLSYLSRNQGISQARLAYLTETDPMTLGRLLGRMEARGLLERRPNPDDRRVRTLFLRPSAAPLQRKIWRLSDLALTESLSGISARERAKLMQLMQRIHANLDTLLPGMAERGGGGRTPSRRRSELSEA